MKRDLCKIMACLIGAVALCGLNMADVTAETAFVSTFGEESSSFTTFQ